MDSARDQFWGVGDPRASFAYVACATCGTWLLDNRPAPTPLGAWHGGYYSDDELARCSPSDGVRSSRSR